MAVFLYLIAVIAVVALVSAATGWAFGVLTGNRRLQGFRLESCLAQILVGTGVWILAFGWCSYSGMSALSARLPLACGWGCLLLLALLRRRPAFYWRRFFTAPDIVYLVASGIVLWFDLNLLLRVECAAPTWDTITYVSIGRWLQDNAFGLGVMADDPLQPCLYNVWLYQHCQLRMGSTFLLALVQAYTGLDAMLAHPIVSAWGMLLNLAGIFLLCRWSLRLDRWVAAAAVLTAATAINPLHTSLYQGFQPQLYGTAYFSFVVALLSRATRPHSWKCSHAFTLAVATCTFLSVYSDLAPVLALVAVLFLIVTVWKTRRTGQWRRLIRFCIGTVLGLALLGNVEWFRAWHAIRTQSGAVVGGHIAWEPKTFAAFALGVTPYRFDRQVEPNRLVYAAIVGGLFLIGLLRVVRDRRAAVVGMGLAVYAAMAVYFAFWAINPFTERVGHTWALYKLTKWAFPLVLVIQFAGLARFIDRRSRWRGLLFIPGVAAFFASASHHAQYSNTEALSLLEHTGTRTPLPAWRELHERLDRVDARRIVLIHPGPQQCRYYNLGTYALYPRPLAFPLFAIDPAIQNPGNPLDPWQPGTQVLLWGPLPFGGPVLEHLPSNIQLLDRSLPYIYEVACPAGAVGTDANGTSSIIIDRRETRLSIWSPRDGTVRLSAATSSEADTEKPTSLRFAVVDDPTGPRIVPTAENVAVEVPLHLGYNVVSVQSADARGEPVSTGERLRWKNPTVRYVDGLGK